MDVDVTTAGRDPRSDIFLDDVTVSRKHAEFRREEGRFFVRDVGSLNGTYVNGRRVEETELANDDALQIGKFKLTFYVGE
jgi:pSer/pThr/pTyr-binding forkhead associated (FHA) protein